MRTWMALLMISALAGCASIDSGMQTWVGHTEAELVQASGAPHSSYQLPDGGKVISWETRNARGYFCRQSFTIDSGGVVRSWSYVGC